MRVSMAAHNNRFHMERWVQRVLFLGVAVSGLLLGSGLIVLFVRHEPRPEGPPPELLSLFRSAFAGSGLAIIYLATMLLMATPILRVAVLAIGWTIAGDRRFALVALIVLGLLGLSVALGVG